MQMKGLNKQKLLAILLAVLMLAGHAFIAPEIVSAENGELQPGEVRTYKTATPVPGMVNTWDIKLRVEGRDKEGPAETTRVVLVIDRSGSMQGTRMTEAKNAAKEFVKEVLKDPNLEVAIVSFSSKYDGNWQYPPSELVTVDRTFTRTLTGDQGLNKAIDDLVASGGTHTQAGILKGKELLDALPATIDNKIMVLLSDGLPTFSYEPLNWDIVEATGTNTSSNRHQWYGIYDGHFDESTVVGTGSTLTQSYDQTLGTRPNWVYITKHINNGSAAIRAASDTKASIGQNNLFTIAVGTDATGTDILRQIASQNRAYSTNNPSELEGIYGEIAGIITSQSAVRSAVVTDEMGDGFSVVTDVQIDTFGDGTTELKAPAGTTNQTIKWTFPELKKLVVGTDDIRYAEMTYRIEINPSILDPGIELAEISVDPNHHLYWTNKSTVMTYTNSDDNPDSASFESPKVDPVFLKIKKILTDNQGNLIAGDMIADNLTFDVEIKKSSGGDSANFPHTEALVPNAEDPGYVWLTTLRHEGTYSVEEIGVSSGSLSEYDISYKTDGVDGGTTFEVNHVGNIPRSDIEVEVTNRRNVALVSIGVEKTLSGRPGTSTKTDKFGFVLTGPKLPVDGVKKELTFAGNGTKDFRFDSILFTSIDLGGATTKDFFYTVTEDSSQPIAGITYDENLSRTVTVTLSKDNQGRISAAVDPATVSFTNHYEAEGVEVELGGTKTLENRNKALGDDEFEFALYKSDVDGIEGAHVETVSNVGGIFKFSKLDFDAEGTYYYLIKEVDGGLGWFTYDTKEYLVKVVITDNDEGKLEAAVSYYIYDGEADPPAWVEAEVAAFTNSYLAEGVEVELGGTKTLENRNKALGDDEFEFALYKSDVDGIEGAHVETVSNVGGIFKFSKLDFDAEGTYYYLIKEVDGGLGWFTYDTKEYLVKVVITDNDEGKLEAAVSYYIYDGEADPPAWVEAEVAAFTNSYLADGEWMPEVRKELTGRSLKPGEFSFELNGDGLNHALAATNDGAGRVVFKPIKYTEQDVGKTYYYTVEEIQGNLGGVTYDKHVLKIKVEVKDFENGELDLRVTYDGSTTFTNRYNASGAYAPVATKVAVDFTLEAGQFEFELVDPLGNVLRTAKNTALGGVQFAPLEFGLDDIGKTFVYTIREVEGTLEKIIYDDTEYTLTLTVSDQGDGTLLVQRKAGEAPAIFTNLLEIVGGEEDEIPDDGEKTPATGQQISVYTYLAAAMLVLAVVSAILALKPRKKDTTA
jgi:pilin isopeptide linkage protein